MRGPLVLVVISASILPVGCSMAQATTPDPENRAQCLVAFEYGHEMFRHSAVPDYIAALSMTGRQLYNTQKLKAAGVADGGGAEAIAFAKAHQNDSKMLRALLKKCIDVQQRDPNIVPALVQLTPLVRRVDPICKENLSICQ